MILGIDEVGRGPWAGPLVVGAVVLGGSAIEGLTDSKKLTKKRREELDPIIREQASAFGIGWVHSEELDEIGLSAALVLATRRAVEQIAIPYHEIIIDGTVNFLKETGKGRFVTTLKKADLLVPSVSAASIIAKVARDRYMAQQHMVYPEYGFDSHVGYGTAKHRAAIEQYGVTPLHRRCFAPIYTRLGTSANTLSPSLATPGGVGGVRSGNKGLRNSPASATMKAIGDAAEEAAANYLFQQGHKILERNWKTKYCEIDIISEHEGILYFTEVKYRKSQLQGGGVAAITPAKLRQMKFAVQLYTHAKSIGTMDLRLAVISATGQPPVIETYLEIE